MFFYSEFFLEQNMHIYNSVEVIKMFSDMDQLIKMAQSGDRLKISVAQAEDKTVLMSLKKAYEEGIAEPILIGNKNKIEEILKEINFRADLEIVNTSTTEESAYKAMQLVEEGTAEMPMKGMLNTGTILRAMLDSKFSFRRGHLLSLVSLIYLKNQNRFVMITDGGMNISPGIEEKVEIIENAAFFARKLGISNPKVALLAAVETVNQSMKSTVEAAVISKMSDRGQINAVIDGPLAFDNAVLKKAAVKKGISGEVAGKADILVVPDIESGNILYKTLVVLFAQPTASLIMGANIPLIISSRADSLETKFNSIALGKLFVRNIVFE